MDPNPAAPATVPTLSSLWAQETSSPGIKVWGLLATFSGAASAYHGYKRHENGAHPILWATGWAILGMIFPILTPTVAIAEGFGKSLPARKA